MDHEIRNIVGGPTAPEWTRPTPVRCLRCEAHRVIALIARRATPLPLGKSLLGRHLDGTCDEIDDQGCPWFRPRPGEWTLWTISRHQMKIGGQWVRSGRVKRPDGSEIRSRVTTATLSTPAGKAHCRACNEWRALDLGEIVAKHEAGPSSRSYVAI